LRDNNNIAGEKQVKQVNERSRQNRKSPP